MPMKPCAKCGVDFPEEVFFRKNPRAGANAFATRPVCVGCETTSRTEEKQTDRFAVKARDTLRRHAKRWGMPVTELCERFGWSVAKIKHDFEHAYLNGCPYCRNAFASMGHGLSDMSMDIVDPTKDPFYTTNTKIICQTCNREKGRTPPEVWAHKLVCWARWERGQNNLKNNQMAWSPLWNFFK